MNRHQKPGKRPILLRRLVIKFPILKENKNSGYLLVYCREIIFTNHNMNLKHKILDHYLQVINDKVGMLQKVLTDLKESGSIETKSTAGDKHETALAMLQIEQANVRGQLQEALIKKAALEKINPNVSATVIVNGSLIKTNKGYLWVSVALDKAVIENIPVIALSPQSPLGQKLMGLKEGEIASINSIEYKIENIE